MRITKFMYDVYVMQEHYQNKTVALGTDLPAHSGMHPINKE